MGFRNLVTTITLSMGNFAMARYLNFSIDNEILTQLSSYEPQYWALPLLTTYLNAGTFYDETEKNSSNGKGSGLASILLASGTGVIVAGFGHMGTIDPYISNMN